MGSAPDQERSDRNAAIASAIASGAQPPSVAALLASRQRASGEIAAAGGVEAPTPAAAASRDHAHEAAVARALLAEGSPRSPATIGAPAR